jgi:hypothetical protein
MTENKFRQAYGVTTAVFFHLLDLIGQEKKRNLLLFLYFLRHYPTFRNGGHIWKISPYTFQRNFQQILDLLFFKIKPQVFFLKPEY